MATTSIVLNGGSTYDLNTICDDPDGDALTFSLKAGYTLPVQVTLTPAGVLSATTQATNTTVNVVFVADDGSGDGRSAVESPVISLQIVVPVVPQLYWSDSSNITLSPGDTYSLKSRLVNTTGQDEDYLVIGAPLPSGVTLDAETGVFTVAPTTIAGTTTGIVIRAQTVAEAPVIAMSETGISTDGPNWHDVNREFLYSWKNLGGDWKDVGNAQQGAASYATAAVTTTAAQNVTFNVATLVARLLARNSAFFLHNISGTPCTFATRNHATGPGPALSITTSAGTFTPVCTSDFWLFESSTDFAHRGLSTTMTSRNSLIKFDLTGITGTVTAATLTLRMLSGGPGTVAVDYADIPSLITIPTGEAGTGSQNDFANGVLTATEFTFGVPEQGIANTVAQDTALATHPDVMFYGNFTSVAAATTFWNTGGLNMYMGAGGGSGQATPVAWPEFGLTALRMPSKSPTTWPPSGGPEIARCFKWLVHTTASQPWQTAYPNGPTELYCRYLLEVDIDVDIGITDGCKLPGLNGEYNYGNTVEVNGANDDDNFSLRLWHTKRVASNPGCYRFGTYYYGADWSIFDNGGNGRHKMTPVFLRSGVRYSLEQHVKLNTVVGGVWQNDGVYEVWLNGLKCYLQTNCRFRQDKDALRIGELFFNIYQGGTGSPSQTIHYSATGVCVARQYIGPPKRIT